MTIQEAIKEAGEGGVVHLTKDGKLKARLKVGCVAILEAADILSEGWEVVKS